MAKVAEALAPGEMGVTVEGALRRLFPFGTRKDIGDGSVELPPIMPADVFAAAAHLLDLSGAYQYIVAAINPEAAGQCAYAGPTRPARNDDLKEWTKFGRKWRHHPHGEQGTWSIQALWKNLLSCRSQPLVGRPAPGQRPEWWEHAHALLVISDEASADLGYLVSTSGASGWADAATRAYEDGASEIISIPDNEKNEDDRHLVQTRPVDSMALVADRLVARVMPKARTPALGASMRAMSHNLALLPPHGQGSAFWQRAISKPKVDSDPLHLLLVPFPYRIQAHCFSGVVDSNNKLYPIAEGEAASRMDRWGRFRVAQKWLNENCISSRSAEAGKPDGPPEVWSDKTSRDKFVAFVMALLDEARSDCRSVHGVVLPEYSVDWPTYNALVAALRDNAADVEFLVAGLSCDYTSRSGNYVASTMFGPLDIALEPKAASPPGESLRLAESRFRRKHHRWHLEAGQIREYGLASALHPAVRWWEFLEIEERQIHVSVFRESSIFTAMICEDLARADPAHVFLRALGPNLVFVLLMDGPQLPTRWSARYATVIAEDPGSSVLTLTSLGLVERSNHNRAGSNVVGLWKDSRGELIEIHCAKDHHAVLLSLSGKVADEFTLDGRPNADARAWLYHGHRSVRVSDDRMKSCKWRWMLGQAD